MGCHIQKIAMEKESKPNPSGCLEYMTQPAKFSDAAASSIAHLRTVGERWSWQEVSS